jgi:hypothetical protein
MSLRHIAASCSLSASSCTPWLPMRPTAVPLSQLSLSLDHFLSPTAQTNPVEPILGGQALQVTLRICPTAKHSITLSHATQCPSAALLPAATSMPQAASPGC